MANFNIISPHLDDAVFSAWHLIDQPTTRVLTIFAGIPGSDAVHWWDRLSGFRSGRQAMTIRRQENSAALNKAGADVLNLNYLDRPYADRPPDINQITEDIIARTAADDDFAVNAGIGHPFIHPDHVAARLVGLALQQRGRQVSFYLDTPYAAVCRRTGDWPLRISPAKLNRVFNCPVEISVCQLSQKQLSDKLAAMSCYASQLRLVNLFSLGGLNRDVLTYEGIVTLNQ